MSLWGNFKLHADFLSINKYIPDEHMTTDPQQNAPVSDVHKISEMKF